MTPLFRLAVLSFGLVIVSSAHADPGRDAGKHFQRGVELYNDGDFRGALVEFKTAYTIWPRANVLYDVGQAEYQLHDYAASLHTMERYLADTGPNADHRAEVESTVAVLRERVGKVLLSTDRSGCTVSIDEQPAGTTPLGEPVLVSVGTRRITITCQEQPPTSRSVEIPAGETVRVEIKLGPLPTLSRPALTAPVAEHVRSLPSKLGVVVGWTLSAILAAVTAGLGAAALIEQGKLESLRQSYPVTRDALDRQSNLTGNLANAFDGLGAATLAAVGVSTYLTVKYSRARKVALSLGASGVALAWTF